MSEQEPLPEPHLPPPTLWPIGFAVGIAVLLVGLIINPLWIATIGGAIAVVFGLLWARDATAELRGQAIHVEPERAELREAGTGEIGPPAHGIARRISGSTSPAGPADSVECPSLFVF